MTVRDLLISICKREGWDWEDQAELEQVLWDYGTKVWSGDIDFHRWYGVQEVVHDIDGHYVSFIDYVIKGGAGMDDMDLQHNIDEAKFVDRKTRTVEEVYYE